MKPCGFVLLSKETGKTTFQSLSPLKRFFKGNKVGHAGTLDSEATGLIVAAVGSATRMLSFAESQEKLYSFQLHLGFSTETGEASGEVIEEKEASHLTIADIDSVLPQFRGPISQTPPLYSAVKINGKRASDRVRAGEEVVLKSREIEILSLEWQDKDSMSLLCRCTKGTYIRSLGRDIGLALGVPACVSKIHRLEVGNMSLQDAIPFDAEDFSNNLIPLQEVLSLPQLEFSETSLDRLQHGLTQEHPDVQKGCDYLVVADGESKLYGVGRAEGVLQPKAVFQ